MGRTKRKRLQRRLGRSIEVQGFDSAQVSHLYAYLGRLGWCNETQLTVRSFCETGRGLCSKRDLRTGDVLIRLPFKALLTIDTLEADEDFKSIFDESLFSEDFRIPFQCLLAFYLLYHKHLSSQSHMEPFLNTLPTSFATPFFCSTNELYCLPESILEKTVAQNREIRSGFQNLHRAVSGQCEYFQKIFNIDTFKWSYFAINSRCVYVRSSQVKSGNSCGGFFTPLLSDSPNLALAPFLDLFNHSAEINTSAELLPCQNSDHTNLEFVLTLKNAPTFIQPRYSQLFINYGALPNLKLLTEYGFVLPHNKHDFFDISLLDIEHLIQAEKTYVDRSFHRNKFKFIREHNLNDQMFVHLLDGASHNLRVVLHLLFKESSHYPNILNQVAFGDASQFEDVDDVLHMLIEFKIREYKTFIDELKKLSTLTESGAIVFQYLEECIRYLEEYLDICLN